MFGAYHCNCGEVANFFGQGISKSYHIRLTCIKGRTQEIFLVGLSVKKNGNLGVGANVKKPLIFIICSIFFFNFLSGLGGV